MASFSQYKVNDEQGYEVLLYWDCYYVLANGVLLRTKQMESWCRNCRTVVAAEYIPSVNEILEENGQYNDRTDSVHKLFDKDYIARKLLENEVRLEWLKTRNSSARCLVCQKANVLHLDSEAVTDPESGTRIELVSGGHAGVAHEIMRRLTPEGMLIETDDPFHSVKVVG